MSAPNFIPLYVRMARDLKDAILDGTYAMGDAIPSESELMRSYSTTRGTVRNALAVLVNEGLVRQVRGKGTFVQLRQAAYTIRNFGGFTDTIQNSTQRAISRVASTELRVVEGEEWFVLVRLRGIETGTRIDFVSLDTSRLPTRLFPGIQDHTFEDISLYQLLRDAYGVEPARTEVTLRPHVPDPDTARLLEEPHADAPLLRVEGSAYDTEGRLIEHIDVVYGSSVQFDLVTAINRVPQLTRP
jgi:GntR family transcriptional regulator